jgi:peptide/nickel transport system substrate-binding protein
MDGLIAKWKRTNTVESRRSAGFEIQTLFNQRPTSIALYYPEERWAVRPAVFNGWTGSPAYGIFHKWSFLPADARVAAR